MKNTIIYRIFLVCTMALILSGAKGWAASDAKLPAELHKNIVDKLEGKQLVTIEFKTGSGYGNQNNISEGSTPVYIEKEDVNSGVKITIHTSGESFVAQNFSNGLFYGFSSLIAIVNLGALDVSAMTDMNNMFNGCAKLVSVDLSKFNTSKVTNMNNMFNGCSSLMTLDMTGFDMSKVITMTGMFSGCSSLSAIYSTVSKPSTLKAGVFSSVGSKCTLYVPEGSQATYKKNKNSAPGWCELGKVQSLDNIVLEDTKPYTIPSTIECKSLTYSRNFKNTNYQALYVPFVMEYDDWKDDFTVYSLNNVSQYDTDNDGVMDLTKLYILKVTEGYKLKAGYPYLIKAKTTGVKQIKPKNATLHPCTEMKKVDCYSVSQYYTFEGNYMSRNDLYDLHAFALASGELRPAASANATLTPYRWCMTIDKRDSQFNDGLKPELETNGDVMSVKFYVIGEDDFDDETEVNAVEQNASVVEYYNAAGLRSSKPLKGINVVKMSDGTTRKIMY
ncbi:MAG: DUF285 domain-containing protein [Bacteroidaceae bacterium]|nr:DUF285 domain-containing protein [Bacteroidaceae bacterium]